MCLFKFRTEVRYYEEHYTVYQQQACPAEHIICCENYFLIHGHCFRNEKNFLLIFLSIFCFITLF